MSPSLVNLSASEINTIQRIWKELDFVHPSKSLVPTPSTPIRYDYDKIGTFLQNLLYLNDNASEFQLDLIKLHFPFLIQIFTVIIMGLNSKDSSTVSELTLKFSKINSRIYDLNYQEFGDCLLTTILSTIRVSNHDQFVFIKFLNQILNHFQCQAEDPILDYNVYRLSYSDSNLSSNLSLTNEDMDSIINDNVSSITVQKHAVNNEAASIDIDEVDDDDFDTTSTSAAVSASVASTSDEEDDAFDLLNSFNTEVSSKSENMSRKKSRRLSSINLKSSKTHLARVSSNTTSKQDCTIM